MNDKLIIQAMADLITAMGADGAIQSIVHSVYDTVSPEETLQMLREIKAGYGRKDAIVTIRILMEKYDIDVSEFLP